MPSDVAELSQRTRLPEAELCWAKIHRRTDVALGLLSQIKPFKEFAIANSQSRKRTVE